MSKTTQKRNSEMIDTVRYSQHCKIILCEDTG